MMAFNTWKTLAGTVNVDAAIPQPHKPHDAHAEACAVESHVPTHA